MKLECVKDSIQKALSKVERATSKTTTLPVLQNILFSLEKNTLFIRATNLDLGIEISIPVKGLRDGLVVFSGSLLSSFLNTIKDKQINIDLHSGSLLVSTKTSSAVLKTYPTDDFPTIPTVPDDTSFNIKSSDLVSGLKSVWFAASSNSIKPELSSVYIYYFDNKLYFVATDSFRLGEKKISLQINNDFSSSLIPIKNVPEIIKVFEDVNETIKVSVTQNQISFQSGGVYLTSRVIEGNFPDYKQIIPKQATTTSTILKEDVVTALKTATIFSDKFNQITVTIDPKKKNCEFQAKNSEVGEGVQQISATITGEALEMNFNHKYLSDCFQSIQSDSVSFSFNGSHKPLIIRGVGEESFLYLVMPMNK